MQRGVNVNDHGYNSDHGASGTVSGWTDITTPPVHWWLMVNGQV
jgi:hypothetical protein